jgi:hypothetical protein
MSVAHPWLKRAVSIGQCCTSNGFEASDEHGARGQPSTGVSEVATYPSNSLQESEAQHTQVLLSIISATAFVPTCLDNGFGGGWKRRWVTAWCAFVSIVSAASNLGDPFEHARAHTDAVPPRWDGGGRHGRGRGRCRRRGRRRARHRAAGHGHIEPAFC